MAIPLVSAAGRIFIRLPGGVYTYYGNGKLGSLSKSFGESAPIYAPDPTRAGRFKIVGRIPNTEENFWTTTIVGQVLDSADSKLARAALSRCPIDIQAHYGVCNDPTDFSDYESAWIIEDARISQYQTTDLVALEPKDTTVIQETVNISAVSATRLLNRKLGAYGSPLTGMVTSLLQCAVSCSSACELNGCGRLYALAALNNVGVVSLQIWWTDDGGLTFSGANLNNENSNFLASVNYRGFQIQCTKDYVIVFNQEGSPGYSVLVIPHTAFFPSAGVVETTPIVSGAGFITYTSFSAGGSVYYAGNSRVIHKINNQLIRTPLHTFSVDVQVTASDGLDGDNMIFFYNPASTNICYQFVKTAGGPFISTLMNTASLAADSNFPSQYASGVYAVDAVAMISPDNWVIGNDLGDVLITTDGGATWEITRSFFDPVVGLEMVTPNIGYCITSFTAGVYRTIDGGRSWTALPAGASWPVDAANNRINLCALAACADPNTFFVGGGQGGNADISTPITPSLSIATTTVFGYGLE